MLSLVVVFLGCAAILADWFHFRRLSRQTPGRHTGGMIWCGLTDSIPFVMVVVEWSLRDNTTAFIAAAMWLVWVWMVTVLPRLLWYTLRFCGLPRTGVVLGAGLVALFVWGATAGRSTLRVERVEVCSERLPAGFDGMRIVQLSDMHVGTLVCPRRELVRLVDSVNALHPEAVIFTGDLVNIRASELDDRVRRLLARIEAPVYSVTGNHDVGVYIKDSLTCPLARNLREFVAAQQAMGWRVLDNETIYLRRGGDSITLSGISFDPELRKRRHDRDVRPSDLDRVYRGVPDTLYNITAVHLPQFWDAIAARGYGDLTLSGHVHSMQMKLRLGGWSWSPAAWLYMRWSGRYDEAGRTLYINDGTGYVGFPMRLGAAPEITLITLRRCE